MDASLQALIEALPSQPLADLLSVGVCSRCVFRFFGLRNAIYSNTLYANFLVEYSSSNGQKQEGLIQSNELAAGEKTGDGFFPADIDNPCVACLGIFQFLEAITESTPATAHLERERSTFSLSKANILEAIRREGHQLSNFSFEVTLPGAVLVRERAVWQYLQEKHGSQSFLQGKYQNEHVVPLKEALKWALTKPLEDSLQAIYESGSNLKIVLVYKHSEVVNELGFPGCSSKRRRKGPNEHNGDHAGEPVPTESLAAIQRCLASMSYNEFTDLYPCPPPKCTDTCQLDVSCHRTSIFVGGRYLKLSRNISQSRWLIGEERMGDGSVEEIIADVLFPHFKADSYKFHAAGREDIDVRMLGTGRPFMLEFSNARSLLSREEIQKMEECINNLKEGWVTVRNLQLVGNDVRNLMLEGESEKQKEYTAVIWLSKLVTDAEIELLAGMKDLEIQQKTPVRVLHRRSPLVRPRSIHWLRLEKITGTEHYFLLHVCTQAGTYIKEFVHGDLGRTHPNVGSLLGCEAEILQLDVTDIKMDLFNE